MQSISAIEGKQLTSAARRGDIRALGRLLSQVMVEVGTVTAVAGAATLNKRAGKVTSAALTTAAGNNYTLTLTNSEIVAADLVLVTVDNGTNTTVGIAVHRVTPGAGQVVILIRNTHATVALNGTVKVSFFVVKA